MAKSAVKSKARADANISPKTKKKPPRLALCALGLDQLGAAYNLLLDQPTGGFSLRRYLYLVEPMKLAEPVKSVSAEALFPEPLLALRNLYISLPGGAESDLLRDGISLLCLRHLAGRRDVDGLLLLRGRADLAPLRPWLGQASGGAVLQVGSDVRPDAAIALRAGHPDLAGILAAALDLYQTGAVLGLERYSLNRVLGLAAEIHGP